MTGIVMDINEKKAVIYGNEGQMIETANRNYRIGQRVQINTHPYIKYAAVAACFLMFCITGFLGHLMYNTPESYIYLDINPSIRLDINCFEHVIAVVPLNVDAAELLTAHPVKNKKTDDCINTIVEACREDKYINEENNNVQIEVMTDKPQLKNTVVNVSDNLKKNKLTVNVSDVDKNKNKQAIELKISAKRLEALEEFADTFGVDVNTAAKNLEGISTKEIYSRIENENQKTSEPETQPSEHIDNTPDSNKNQKPNTSAPQNSKNPNNTNPSNGNENKKETPNPNAEKNSANSNPGHKNETIKQSDDNSSSSKQKSEKSNGNSKNESKQKSGKSDNVREKHGKNSSPASSSNNNKPQKK